MSHSQSDGHKLTWLQDYLLYESLTVWETLYFAAMLRLPREFTTEQKKQRVAKVIAALGLNRCKDTIIGELHVYQSCCWASIHCAQHCTARHACTNMHSSLIAVVSHLPAGLISLLIDKMLAGKSGCQMPKVVGIVL